MRYWPLPSVTTARAPSMSAGLDASTVAPGNTPPEVSLTTPVMDAWAYAAAGTTASHVSTTDASRRYGLRFTLTSCASRTPLNADIGHWAPPISRRERRELQHLLTVCS